MSVKRYVAGGIAAFVAVVFAVLWVTASADARAYRAAPACPVDTVDISGCRWTVTAPVVGAAADRHGRSVSYRLTVDVPTLGRTDVLLSSYEALYDRAATSTGGYPLRVTGWHRDVVTLADDTDEIQAADAPLTDAHLSLTLAAVALVLAALLFVPGPPGAPPTVRRALAVVLVGALVAMVTAGAVPTASLIVAYGVGAVAAGVLLLGIAVARLARSPRPAG